LILNRFSENNREITRHADFFDPFLSWRGLGRCCVVVIGNCSLIFTTFLGLSVIVLFLTSKTSSRWANRNFPEKHFQRLVDIILSGSPTPTFLMGLLLLHLPPPQPPPPVPPLQTTSTTPTNINNSSPSSPNYLPQNRTIEHGQLRPSPPSSPMTRPRGGCS
jgi:hypothetical protein